MLDDAKTLTGDVFTLRFLKSYKKSLKDTFKRIPLAERTGHIAEIETAFKYLRTVGRVEKTMVWKPAGTIKDSGGQKFWELNKRRLRIYGWISEKYPDSIVFSHSALKDTQKTAPDDTKLISERWKKMEK